MSDWKELWLSNYRGEGDTHELEKQLKRLDYGPNSKRGDITYLPWATVERIFRLQGGQVELLYTDTDRKTSVEKDSVYVRDEIEDGVIYPKYINSYFINIQVEWQGQTYVERYPLQDNKGNPLVVWSQNELNKAYQRGKVKAIAIVSGIGYKLFEDGDLQFDDNETKSVNVEAKITKKEPKPAPAPKQEKQEEPVVEKEVVIEKVTEKLDLSRVELENKIKEKFLTGGEEKATLIKNFLKEKETLKVADLNDKDINTLYQLII